MRKFAAFLLIGAVLLSACAKSTASPRTPVVPPTGITALPPTSTSAPAATTAPAGQTTPAPPETSTPTIAPYAPKTVPGGQTAKDGIPVFEHIIVILFENTNYRSVVGNRDLPNFNRFLKDNVSFTHYYGVTHPSLPNYIALLGGDTFGIQNDCLECSVNKVSLPDLIDKAGYTWKTYQENMPEPCYSGYTHLYDKNHNPFAYYDPIFNDPSRCKRSVVPLSQLDSDLGNNLLPNFAFIMPDICNSGHSCDLTKADAWLGQMVDHLQSSPALGNNYMIFFTFDEADADNSGCCGIANGQGGGRVAAGMISPRAQPGFVDDTPLDHYSLLKTILLSWDLPALGFTSSPSTQPITQPWK